MVFVGCTLCVVVSAVVMGASLHLAMCVSICVSESVGGHTRRRSQQGVTLCFPRLPFPHRVCAKAQFGGKDTHPFSLRNEGKKKVLSHSPYGGTEDGKRPKKVSRYGEGYGVVHMKVMCHDSASGKPLFRSRTSCKYLTSLSRRLDILTHAAEHRSHRNSIAPGVCSRSSADTHVNPRFS